MPKPLNLLTAFWFQVKVNDLSKFKAIASDENNAFKIDDYRGLTGILEKFQTRIFKIEGDVYYSFVCLSLCTI